MRQRTLNARQRSTAHHTIPLGRSLSALVLVGVCSLSASAAGAATVKSVTLTQASNGRVVTVKAGTDIDVKLTGNDWTFSSTGLNKIASLSGTTTYKENKPIVTGGFSSGASSTCQTNCTFVEAHYVALRTGRLRITATRSSCPTSAACSTAQRQWTVVVRIR